MTIKNFCLSMKTNWKLLTILIIGLILTVQEIKAQDSKADSIAISRSIHINKILSARTTIYDHGQTKMTLEPIEMVTPQGSLYFSKLYLEIPNSNTTAFLSLNKTKLFLEKLYGIYQIDKYKDSGARNSSSWGEKKDYYFGINAGGNSVYFRLTAAPDNQVKKSKATGSINGVSFTINDFTENRKRTEFAIDEMREVVKGRENELAVNLLASREGARGYQIDYRTFYDSGLEVYKSGVHDTNNLRILSDKKIGRSQRIIPISKFDGQFDDYTIVRDDQLNFYAQEEISIASVTEEIVSLVKQYNGDGVLDLQIFREGSTIYTTFSIVKSGNEQARPKGQNS